MCCMATQTQRTVEDLVRRYLPLARRLAWRYAGRGEPFEDLVQVASLGLLNAAKRYDESRPTAFAAYAIPMITGELKRHFRDRCWALYVPRSMKDRALMVNRAIQHELESSGIEPTQTQLAERLSLPEQDIVDALEAWSALRTSSLEAPVRRQAGQEPQQLAEVIGSADSGYQLVEQRLTRMAAMRELTAVEQRIFYLRYAEQRSQRAIAARIGISQTHVSRVLSGVLRKLSLGAGHGEHEIANS